MIEWWMVGTSVGITVALFFSGMFKFDLEAMLYAFVGSIVTGVLLLIKLIN